MRNSTAVLLYSIGALFLGCTVGAPTGFAFYRFKTTIGAGYTMFIYRVPGSSGNNGNIGLHNAWDLHLGNASVIGIDIAMAFDIAKRQLPATQTTVLYKIYPWTFVTPAVGGDPETKVEVRSSYYPYFMTGAGFSTVIVKTSAALLTGAQYFHLAGGMGADFPIGRKWGLNAQLLASFGMGGTSDGNMTSMGVVGTLNSMFYF